MLNLKKSGQIINLKKDTGSAFKNIQVGLGWRGVGGRTVDLDSYVTVVRGGRNEFIYFGHQNTNGVHHNGDDTVGGGGANTPNETINITVGQLTGDTDKIICGFAIYRGIKDLSGVENAFIVIKDMDTGKDLVRFDLAKFKASTEVITGEFIKRNGEWYFKALGAVSNKSFSQIRSSFDGSKVREYHIPTGEETQSAPASEKKGFFAKIFGG